MKADLATLNDHLHRMLGQLVDPGDADGVPLDEDAERTLIARAAAVCGVADRIIGTARVVLDAQKLKGDMPAADRLPRLLGTGGGDQ